MIPQNSAWSFENLCLYGYCIVDDLLIELKKRLPELNPPGPKSECSDSELIAMCLVGECMGWDVETELLLHFAHPHSPFPHLPHQSRFNRRRRRLSAVVNLIRQSLLKILDLAQDRQCIIDSLPVPVVQFHLVPGTMASSAGAHWKEHQASFGKVASRKQTIFGYKLHLLITGSGVILDFLLAPANVTDLAAGHELLSGHHAMDVVGDKGYISAFVADELRQFNQVHLMTEYRQNQHRQLSSSASRILMSFRQLIETVNAQLNSQFRIETNHAHSFSGLCARLYAKLTAHTLSVFINRLLGNPDWLQIKSLAMVN